MGIAKTNEQFVQEFNELFGEDYQVMDTYISAKTSITIQHKCGYSFNRIPNCVLSKKRCICPKCFPHEGTTDAIPYINDIYTTNKQMYDLLVDKSDGHKYKQNSTYKTFFKCPECGYVIKAQISKINTRGFSCPYCSDGLLYPNKFMRSLLDQLHIKYQAEFTAPWCPDYRYDFCFEYNTNKYVIEMDGAYGHGCTNTTNRTIEEQLTADAVKDVLAEQNGYAMIRIDCKYHDINRRKTYVIRNVLKSKMNDIFNLEHVDFDKCDIDALNSVIINVCNSWNAGINSYDDFNSMYNLPRCTIRRYLHCGCENNLIHITYPELLQKIRLSSNQKIANTKGQSILCNETSEVFSKYRDADKKYHCNLSSYFCRNREYAGKLPDGTKLTWTKLSKTEYLEKVKQIS